VTPVWWRVAAKDARVELRGRATLVPALLTGLLVVVVGLLAFHDASERALVAAGVLWIGLAFAAALGLARAFGAERDQHTLDVLLTLPAERGSLYLGKVAASFATILLVALVLVPVYLVAGDEAIPAEWPLLLVVLLMGALGLAATGTMMSALAATARSRETLLPVLLVPLLVPLLLATLDGTEAALSGEPFAAWRNELLILAGYDLAFLAASTLLFESAVGD
jgi:heme exporter protein B